MATKIRHNLAVALTFAKFTSKQLGDFDGHVILSVLCTRLTVQAVSAYLCQVGTFFHHPLPMSIATEYHMH